MLNGFFKHIKSNVLIKLASTNSIAVIIKVIGGFLTSKAIAQFLGAEGLALVGNLRNFLSSAQALSTLGLSNGLVKYISEFKNNKLALSKTISTIFFIGFFSTLTISLLMYLNALAISNYVFGTILDYTRIVKIAAIALPFYVLNVFITGILNGYGKFNSIIVIRIIGHVLGASVTLLLIWQSQLFGALLAVVTVEALLFFVTLVVVVNRQNFLPLIKAENCSFKLLKKLSSYSLMALFSAFTIPLVTLLIRDYIADNLDLKSAGYWEAMNRISKYYLMFISSLLALYVLPKYAALKTNKAFRKEVLYFYKTIMPIFGLGLIVIYLLRGFIVAFLFNDSFMVVEHLFKWQLLGDFFKVLSIVIAYQFLAKRMVVSYLVTECLFYITYYLLSIYFLDFYGLEGVNLAYLLTYMLYFIGILFLFRKALFSRTQD